MPIIKIRPEEHPTICRLFKEERHTIDRLALDYGVSTTCIERILRRHNCRRSCRVRALDLTYFETVDTPNKAYFLGLIYADGCNKGRSIAISLQEEDSYLIEAFKKEVGFDGKTYRIKRKKPHHKLRLGVELSSVKMCDDIEKLGVMPAKSLVLQFPEFISPDLMPHFLRGYFDGDGTLCTSTCNGATALISGITSSPDFCDGFRKYLASRLGIKGWFGDYTHSKAKDIKMTTRASMVFLDHIYRDSPVRMTRKFNKFIDFMNGHRSRGTCGSTIPEERITSIKAFWTNQQPDL